MALIKCPECGRMVSPNALECPACGAPVKDLLASGFPAETVDHPQPTQIPEEHLSNKVVSPVSQDTGSVKSEAPVHKKGKGVLWALVAVVAMALATAAFLLFFDKDGLHIRHIDEIISNYKRHESGNTIQCTDDGRTLSDGTIIDSDRIRKLVDEYWHAFMSNDFSTLERLYAPSIEHFYYIDSAKSRDLAMEDHRNAAGLIEDHMKPLPLRWETLKIERISSNRIEAVIDEDCEFDQSESTLKTHYLINSDYQIVGIWYGTNSLAK